MGGGNDGGRCTHKCVKGRAAARPLHYDGCLLTTQYAQMRNFAAECSAGGASETLQLVFVLSASNLEHDYLGLLAVLEAIEDGGPASARPAQPTAT